jgi:hypothetical protein
MGMFGPKPGTWWVGSKTDPRWNGSGSAEVGGFAVPEEAKKHIEAMKRKLGKPRPTSNGGT